MSILFILGLYQSRKPQRWRPKHKVFSNLSQSLAALGIDSYFLCNPRSVKSRFIGDTTCYFYEGEKDLASLVREKYITHVVIWGGRTEADQRIRDEVGDKVKIVYGEYGWFPQSQHCYFSPNGTNADANFLSEGLSEHILDRKSFLAARSKLLLSMLGWRALISRPDFFEERQFDTQKQIFVPLQDEMDTNIMLSSPVKTMSAFVEGLASNYPDYRFLVRPHPRASYESLPTKPNIEYQAIEVNPFRNYSQYGGVFGINSTMLLQFALLGLPVAGIGKGVASGTEVYADLDWSNLPSDLGIISSNPLNAAKVLDFMLRVKQIRVKDLKKSRYVERSYIYNLFTS